MDTPKKYLRTSVINIEQSQKHTPTLISKEAFHDARVSNIPEGRFHPGDRLHPCVQLDSPNQWRKHTTPSPLNKRVNHLLRIIEAVLTFCLKVIHYGGLGSKTGQRRSVMLHSVTL